ncbi:hypothetical protein Gohar_021383 [Gossypium harknessii]|uniref:Uncharacterized protein n=1 Tax=Gossypium harknessii TaxID=34285 RepID=A0A7J9I8Q1_9ROSI|nr:hypothetical protein [Gossypium harknessii]
MEKRFLDKVEDNAAVRIWAETMQQEKGDSLTEGWIWYLLWKSTRLCSVARIFKLTRFIPELPTFQRS